MKSLLIASVAVLLLGAVSCGDFGRRVKGNGNRITQTRNVNDASRIKVSGSFKVVISKGETSVKVEGDENLLQFITTDFDEGTLKIATKSNVNIQSDKGVVVYISTPEINQIKMAGSGEVTGNEKFVSNGKMIFGMTGSGSITLAVNTPNVESSITGSGSINLSGETRDLKVKITGSGDFNAFDLKAENAKVSIAGSGNAYVYSDVNMSVDIAGSGVVEYKGNAEVNKKIAGSGSITRR